MGRYELIDNTERSRYEFDLGDAVAVIDYEDLGDGSVALTHTGVPDRYSGQGIAAELTQAVLEDLKRKGLKVVPQCSFAALYIVRNPEWKALLR